MAKLKVLERFDGQRFAVAGKLVDWPGNSLERFVKWFGGKLTSTIDKNLTCLIVGQVKGKSMSPEQRKVNDLTQNQGASILVLTPDRFHKLAQIPMEQFMELLKSGPEGLKVLKGVREISYRLLPQNYDHADFHGLNLDGMSFGGVLKGVNLRKASLRGDGGASFDRCQLEDADLRGFHVYQMTHCNAARLKAHGIHRVAQIDGTDFTKAEFTKAELCFFEGSDVTAPQSIWTGASSAFTKIRKSDFSKAQFSDSSWYSSEFSAVKFTQADFHDADLVRCKFSECDLSGVDFRGAKLEFAEFRHCNLNKANLGKTNLSESLFQDCTFEKTIFTSARVIGARMDESAVARAVGLDMEAIKIGRAVGPHLQAVDKLASKCKGYKTGAVVRDAKGTHAVSAESHSWTSTKTFSGRILRNVRLHPGAKVEPNSIRTSFSGLTIPRKEAEELVVRAWYEAFETPMPEADEKKRPKATHDLQKEWLDVLLEKNGISKWNKAGSERKHLGVQLHKAKLAGRNLKSLDVKQTDCSHANFEGANLNEANAYRAKLSHASLRSADCRKMNFNNATLLQTDLSNADANGAWFRGARMKGAICRATNFKGAHLDGADLCGADFSDAVLEKAKLNYAKYDENTKFPQGFTYPPKMRWVGKGQPPSFKALVPAKPAGPMDIAMFVKRLEENTEAAKLEKALDMLKTDRFKLYAEVTPDSLTGVVKSQTDPELVYSCKLASDGSFSCCTQNLNLCGGLRGALCKHLLVLVIGLTKTSDLKPDTIDTWVLSSKGQKPLLDKEAMSDTFLRYKGAEAGEIDWRPTETVPEDYYAM